MRHGRVGIRVFPGQEADDGSINVIKIASARI
jgi:hypothetical protein